MNYLLFNPLANNGTGVEAKNNALDFLKEKFGQLVEVDVTTMNVDEFLSKLTDEDKIILVGGDGTLNHLANNVYGKNVNSEIYLYRAGTGNDFLKDILEDQNEKIVLINEYLKNLPTITVNGNTSRYINGIGYGIDGMVCQVADELKARGKKKISYSGLSIKLLLTKYRCPDATVYVDGEEYHFKKVWLASAMKGRYYGGGLMIAPNQDRKSDKLTLAVIHSSGRLKTLMLFPSIFKGEHLKYKKNFTAIVGNSIEVKFSSPMALQIDGETVLNVSSYKVEL